MTRYIAYIRVSTARQGQSGLGLDAQRKTIADYVTQKGGDLVAEYREVESGKRCERPKLDAALAECRLTGAVLVIARLDRLARDAAFLLKVVQDAGTGGVIFCDLPSLPAGPAGKLVLTMFAAVAEYEGGMISQRTKAALAAAKQRGVKLGNPNLPEASAGTARRATEASQTRAKQKAATIRPYIDQARAAGATTYPQIAHALQARGVRTPRGNVTWTPTQVRRVEARCA